MHIRLSLYFCTYCVLFSSDIYTTLCLSMLLILLQWFYGLSKIEKVHVQPFQFCVSCKKMTPQHYLHCLQCKRCVPVEHVHTIVGCMSEFSKKRYTTLLYILYTYIMVILLLWSVVIPYYMLLIVIHSFAIYSTFKEKNINTKFVF